MTEYNKYEIRKQLDRRNQEARLRFRRNMQLLFGEDIYNKKGRAVKIDHGLIK